MLKFAEDQQINQICRYPLHYPISQIYKKYMHKKFHFPGYYIFFNISFSSDAYDPLHRQTIIQVAISLLEHTDYLKNFTIIIF